MSLAYAVLSASAVLLAVLAVLAGAIIAFARSVEPDRSLEETMEALSDEFVPVPAREAHPAASADRETPLFPGAKPLPAR